MKPINNSYNKVKQNDKNVHYVHLLYEKQTYDANRPVPIWIIGDDNWSSQMTSSAVNPRAFSSIFVGCGWYTASRPW